MQSMKSEVKTTSDKITLVILDKISFFASENTAYSATKKVHISYGGEKQIVFQVNKKAYRFDNGMCTILAHDLNVGSNACTVITNGSAIPCEPLIKHGGYVMPGGIMQKKYVSDLYEKCQELMALNAELEKKVHDLEKEEHDHDFFTI